MNSMNVTGLTHQEIGSTTAVRAKDSGRVDEASKSMNNAAAPAQTPQGDQASLSYTSGLLAQALSHVDSQAGRLAAIQQAIVSGTYSVSATNVADKLMQTMAQSDGTGGGS
jgi:flagellar biosynthesis anti-sigma factor FlgM